MRFDQIDWIAVWKDTISNATVLKHREEKDPIKFWNSRAFQFNEDAKRERTEDVDEILGITEITNDATILDVGAGTGRFSIPLAKRVNKVTAIDPSSEMLKHLAQNAAEAGLQNKIKIINRKWEEVVLGEDIEMHDIVIAPYIIGFLDVTRAIPLFHAAARKWVFIFTWVTRHVEQYRQLWEKVHREAYIMPPEHLLLLSHLYNLGIHANLKISRRSWWSYYSSEEIAFADFKRRVNPPNDAQDHIIWQYVRENGIRNQSNLQFPEGGRSAMIWWSKDES